MPWGLVSFAVIIYCNWFPKLLSISNVWPKHCFAAIAYCQENPPEKLPDRCSSQSNVMRLFFEAPHLTVSTAHALRGLSSLFLTSLLFSSHSQLPITYAHGFCLGFRSSINLGWWKVWLMIFSLPGGWESFQSNVKHVRHTASLLFHMHGACYMLQHDKNVT